MERGPLRKSAKVILTVAAAMGVAARAQQSTDPCEAATFNGAVCNVAIRHNGYCSGGAWVPMTYQQPYPYYYDSYSAFVSGGGLATPAPDQSCKRPGFFAAHGGFGSTGAGRHAGG